mgnify:CR=1 FL=1
MPKEQRYGGKVRSRTKNKKTSKFRGINRHFMAGNHAKHQASLNTTMERQAPVELQEVLIERAFEKTTEMSADYEEYISASSL